MNNIMLSAPRRSPLPWLPPRLQSRAIRGDAVVGDAYTLQREEGHATPRTVAHEFRFRAEGRAVAQQQADIAPLRMLLPEAGVLIFRDEAGVGV